MKAREDYAFEVFLVAVFFQILFIAGGYLKYPLLKSTPIFYAQLIAPLIVVVVASSIFRALRYSILCSLVLPSGMSLILISITTLNATLGGTTDQIVPAIKINLLVSFTIWLSIIKILGPSLFMAFIVRAILAAFGMYGRRKEHY